MAFFKLMTPIFVLFAGIIGFIKWKNITNTYWIFFPFYLVIVALTEVARFYWMNIPSVYTILATVIVPVEFVFFFFLFYKNSQNRITIIIGSIIYIIIFLLETIWGDLMKSDYFMSISYTVGNLILLIFILQYFYKLIYSERILYFYHERMFWVSLGLLVFFLGTFPYFGLYNLLLTKHFKLLVSYTWVEIFLDYAMYLLFAASFIWGKEK